MFDQINIGRWWDKPWSPVSGCTRCSPGCEHCWALAMENRFKRYQDEMGIQRVQTHPERLDIPLRRKKPTAFAVWNDLFHDDVPYAFAFRVFEIICSCRGRHNFLILTKRQKRMAEFIRLAQEYFSGWFSPSGKLDLWGTWLGVTVCNRGELPKIDDLKAVPAAKLFVSIEPLLEDLPTLGEYLDGIDWLICGGETGPGARPMHPDWVRSVRDQCQAAGVPFFFKGMMLDKKIKTLYLDGRTHLEVPHAIQGQGNSKD